MPSKGRAKRQDGSETEAIVSSEGGPGEVRRFRVSVVLGPDRGAAWAEPALRCVIGTHPSNDLVLTDPTVSRFHCEVAQDGGRVRIRDLGAKNGTVVDGVLLLDGFLRGGSSLAIGRTTLHFEFERGTTRPTLSARTSFGDLIGSSIPMRTCFAALESAARGDATILLEGETGTGKGKAALALHEKSSRKGGPFVTVDCHALPSGLIESELFGHEKGAFTGATARRAGAFERAHGGTLFLDEIGELPLELQPKLLRALEARRIRPLGASAEVPVDVHLIAATHRDLRREVNDGRFREDLFFRLAVVRIVLPPLRQHPEDLAELVDRILAELKAPEAAAAQLRAPAFLDRLRHAAWPGNVRELRNHLERCVVFAEPLPLGAEAPEEAPATRGKTYDEARRDVLDGFERHYLTELLREHGGRVAVAARAAGLDRVSVWRLLRKHGLKP